MKNKIIKILLPAGFNFKETLYFLDRNLDDVMHTVTGDSVRRAVSYNNKPVLISVSADEKFINVELLKGKASEDFIVGYIEEWFDLSRDLKPFYRLLNKDKELAPLAKKYTGFHIVGIPDMFEALCWCVIGQQINLVFAYKVKRRLVEKFGDKIIFDNKTYYLFPEPEVLAILDVDTLRSLQLTGKKSEYIIGISELFRKGDLSKDKIMDLEDEKSKLAELIKVRGIGEWTANYALMKSTRAMNCVPYGDSGIHIALLNLKGIPKKNNREQIEDLFNRFENWKTYLVFYLWRSLR